MDSLGALFAGSHSAGPHLVLGVFILFCRIGACLMLAPGFSSVQIPTQVRLFMALAATLALAPMLLDKVPHAALGDDPVVALRYIGTELLVGFSIGFLGRLFFLALETLAVAAATGLGLANAFGIEIDQGETLPPLASFISISATALIFFMNLHWEVLRGLAASYNAVPISDVFHPGFSLRQIAPLAGTTFKIALRVCSPFLIYALIVNFAISLINRLTPQIAIFYISTPFVIGGGMLLLYFVLKSTLLEFMIGFSTWLTTG
jgi:flagellar biosynthesis protein FliR